MTQPGTPPDSPSAASLRPSLGWAGLLVLGVANILGAGVFVMTGTAAASFAGPAVTISFLLAGFACLLVGLCYAELASRLPESGSSYTYTRRTFGALPGWALGWLLFLEYNIAASMLGLGFGGYLVSLLADFGIHVPASVSTSLVTAKLVDGVGFQFGIGHSVNLVAAAACLGAGIILALGISKSALVNSVLVVIKVLVLVGFVLAGAHAVDPTNWQPYIPANEGGFTYGWEGIARAASLLFFAFLGFETVSTAAAETRNPHRDVPVGILGSLAICALLYVSVATVLTGLVPFRELGVADPIALAVDRIGWPVIATLIKIGALAGLGSVLLANAFGHSRVCYAMSNDGYLPRLFSVVHPKRNSLWKANLTLASLAGLGAALLPISVLADMISLGVSLTFAMVAAALIDLRSREPEKQGRFRVPLGGVWINGIWFGTVPVLAIVVSFLMTLPVLLDLVNQIRHGEWLPACLLLTYLAVGLAIYMLYGKPRAQSLQTTAPVELSGSLN
ncbi:amino acid permease [Steroidobacter flavus]|uniref:Amino acid permease n=1 Tax=Steroidobacter flavus TaxID=1842136 RepID=A0ABV8SY05_9GAMM